MGCNCNKASKEPKETLTVSKQRLAVCMTCEHLKDKHTLRKRCAVCGCFMEAKSRMTGMNCPLGKW